MVSDDKSIVKSVSRPTEYPNIYIEPVEIAINGTAQKFAAFIWENPAIKIKMLEDEGVAIVYVDGKAKPGAYCKVYVKRQAETKFFRDGYTDIQGRFKYIMTDI